MAMFNGYVKLPPESSRFFGVPVPGAASIRSGPFGLWGAEAESARSRSTPQHPETIGSWYEMWFHDDGHTCYLVKHQQRKVCDYNWNNIEHIVSV